MTDVQVTTLLRIDGTFLPITSVEHYRGADEYIPGAVSLLVDGLELLGATLWDDVDWFWPSLIDTMDTYRRDGAARTMFPDQPIALTLKEQGSESARIEVTDGSEINRVVSAARSDLLRAVQDGGREYFRELRRICPGAVHGDRDGRYDGILRSWGAGQSAARS